MINISRRVVSNYNNALTDSHKWKASQTINKSTTSSLEITDLEDKSSTITKNII